MNDFREQTERIPKRRTIVVSAAVALLLVSGALVSGCAGAGDRARGSAEPLGLPRNASSTEGSVSAIAPATALDWAAPASPTASGETSASTLGATGARLAVTAASSTGPRISREGESELASAAPTRSRIAAATRWAAGRQGVVAYAVVTSDGRTYGYHVDEQFVTASVIKAMLLTQYLRTHETLSASAKTTLTNMIHVSDNNAATAIYHVVGDAGLRDVARAAGMTHFGASNGTWGNAQLTPADQARFFYRMDSLIPENHDAFARHLLSHISAEQSWGIPAVARPAGWTVFFKGGWRTTTRGQLVHQMSRLEKDGTTISIAVMTDGDPSMDYGIATIRGVVSRLLGLTR